MDLNTTPTAAPRRHDAQARAAAAAVGCLGVGGEDDVVVICNEPQRKLAAILAAAAREHARSVRVLPYPALTRPSEEPPAFVANAMADASVVYAATAFSISHTRARRDATRRGVRIASLPKITEDVFGRALLVDYAGLKRAGERIASQLSAAVACRVTSPAGTDVSLTLDGRSAVCDAGDLQAEGAFGNLPAGEAYIAPIETTGDGVIVFDGALAGYGLLHEPLRVTLEDGRAVDATGEAARWLLDTLDAGGETGRLIAELGIGTNPAARVTGHMLEDEKATCTAHIAFAGLKPRLTSIRGGTDGARLSELGRPTPNLFAGGNELHCTREWISVQDMAISAAAILEFVRLWAEPEWRIQSPRGVAHVDARVITVA